MRFAAVFLIVLFGFGTIDVPVEFLARPYKQCCCKAGFCHCHHKSGSHCQMKSHMAQQVKAAPIKTNGFPVLVLWNCHTGSDKSVPPAWAKENYINIQNQFLISLTSEQFLPLQETDYSFLFAPLFDKPPRLAPSFF